MELIDDLDMKVEIFTQLVNESLDEVAPMSSFSIRSNHVFCLSESTKELMKKRDEARQKISEVSKLHNTKYFLHSALVQISAKHLVGDTPSLKTPFISTFTHINAKIRVQTQISSSSNARVERERLCTSRIWVEGKCLL